MAKLEVVHPEIFRHERRVDESEIDELGHVSNVDYVRWVQEVAKAHSAHVHWDYPAYLELGAVFVVRRHELDYLRPALAGERVELTTWIEAWSAATSVRRTRIARLTDGVELARATTTWALVSTESGRPTRIPEGLRRAFSQPGNSPATDDAGRAP